MSREPQSFDRFCGVGVDSARRVRRWQRWTSRTRRTVSSSWGSIVKSSQSMFDQRLLSLTCATKLGATKTVFDTYVAVLDRDDRRESHVGVAAGELHLPADAADGPRGVADLRGRRPIDYGRRGESSDRLRIERFAATPRRRGESSSVDAEVNGEIPRLEARRANFPRRAARRCLRNSGRSRRRDSDRARRPPPRPCRARGAVGEFPRATRRRSNRKRGTRATSRRRPRPAGTGAGPRTAACPWRRGVESKHVRRGARARRRACTWDAPVPFVRPRRGGGVAATHHQGRGRGVAATHHRRRGDRHQSCTRGVIASQRPQRGRPRRISWLSTQREDQGSR